MKMSKTTTIVSKVISGALAGRRSSPVATAAGLLVLASVGQVWGQPSEVTTLLAPVPAANDEFGHSVAIDGVTTIVGARFDDHGEPLLSEAGSAHIYQDDFGGQPWGFVATVTALDASAQDEFGTSVSIRGDIAIVGAPLDDDACPPGNPDCDSGSVYIFERNIPGNNQWGQVAKLTASDAQPGDQFGFSVSIRDDVIVVGAPLDDDACPPEDPDCQTGSAYIFLKPSDGWVDMTETLKRTADDAEAGDQFGHSVSFSDDIAIVGSPFQDDWCPADPNCNSGSAYIFDRNCPSDDDWGQVTQLTPAIPQPGEQFGFAVSISLRTALVGAIFGDTDGVEDSGAAYAFLGNSPTPCNWIILTKLSVSGGLNAGDQFGRSVSIEVLGAAVGAPFSTPNGGEDSGIAYIFGRKMGGPFGDWLHVGTLPNPVGAAEDHFGDSVAISDTVATIGATGDDQGANDAGAAYVFEDVCPCPWDLNSDGSVGILDLLALIVEWGACPDPCSADFDGDEDVDVIDLLILIAHWGKCTCIPGIAGPSREEVLTEAGLSEDDWDLFLDCLTTGTPEEQANCQCWFDYYINGCDGGPRQACSDHDPFTDCVGDLNGDCCVNELDTQILLNQAGPCPAGPGACLGDLNGDCVVDRLDHSDLLSHFGACPGTQYCPTAPPGCGPTTTTQLEGAVTLMGFSDVPDYQAHISATSEGEAFVCACVLQVLLEVQP